MLPSATSCEHRCSGAHRGTRTHNSFERLCVRQFPFRFGWCAWTTVTLGPGLAGRATPREVPPKPTRSRWYSVGDLNPCFHRERVVSWAGLDERSMNLVADWVRRGPSAQRLLGLPLPRDHQQSHFDGRHRGDRTHLDTRIRRALSTRRPDAYGASDRNRTRVLLFTREVHKTNVCYTGMVRRTTLSSGGHVNLLG